MKYGYNLKYYKLKGRVKSIRETKYSLIDNFGDIIKGDKLSPIDYKEFDLNGNKIIENSYNLDGSLKKKSFHQYDTRNNEILSNSKIFYLNSIQEGECHWKYNEDGKLVEFKAFNNGNQNNFETYNYDRYGRLMELNKHVNISPKKGEYEEAIWKTVYLYDEDGNLIEKSEYSYGDSLGNSSKFYYNNNILIKSHIIVNDSYNNYEKIIHYKYDSQSNVIEEAEYYPSGKISGRKKFKYDADNNRIEILSYHTTAEKFYSKYVNCFDSHRNIIASYIYNSENILTRSDRYLFEYDSIGNWTKKISESSSKIITEREIKYHS